MKKTLSLLLVMAMCISILNVSAQGEADQMQKALVAVKSKIDVPLQAVNFESGSYSGKSGTMYSFYWSDTEHNMNVNVECDSLGRIGGYSFNKSTEEDVSKLSTLTKNQVFDKADLFIKKALPELFKASDDCLVYNDSESYGRVTHNNTRYTFVYERKYKDVPVLGNTATVSAVVRGNDILINNMSCSWQYDIEFTDAADFEGDIAEKYFSQYPLELVYQKQYSYVPLTKENDTDTATLLYRFKDGECGYVSASTGEKMTVDSRDDFFKEESSTSDMVGGGGANRNEAQLTEAELKELVNISNLISQSEAENKLKSYKELNIGSLKTSSFSVSKNEEKYIVNINMNSENSEKNHYFNGSLDGKTGEIISLNNHIYRENNNSLTSSDYLKAVSIAEDFAQKVAKDKIKECSMEKAKENTSYVRYYRLVNGVKYVDNTIAAGASAADKYISSYRITWDDDVSSFTSPEKAIAPNAAYKIVKSEAPIRPIYILSGGKFVKCFAPDTTSEIKIDAVTGEFIRPDTKTNTKTAYDDISGHWCEPMVKALSDVGIGLEKTSLNPDSSITQEDFLRLMMCAFSSGATYRTCTSDELYKRIYTLDIIKEEERSDSANIKREDAFYYMIKFMDYEKIAQMDIFRSDFADSTNLSKNRLGATALLTGFGVVNGDDGKLRPIDNITPAETVALIYNYLTKN